MSQIHGTLKCAMLVCSLSEEGRPFLMFWVCLCHKYIHKQICGTSLNLSISAAFYPTPGEGGGTRGTNQDLWLLCGNARRFMARDPTISDPFTCRQTACLPDADTVSTALARHPSPSGSSWSSSPVAPRVARAGFLQLPA